MLSERHGVAGGLGDAHAGMRPHDKGRIACKRDPAADHVLRLTVEDPLYKRPFGRLDRVGERTRQKALRVFSESGAGRIRYRAGGKGVRMDTAV
jgi:hypothetical protein